MPPKNTTQDAEIELAFPEGAVRMLYPSPLLSTTDTPSPSPIPGVDASYIVANIIPPQSNFAVHPHWHELYTEHFRVARGYVLLRLGQKHIVVGPEDGDIAIRRGVIHGFCRADISIPGGRGLGAESAERAWRARAAEEGKLGEGQGSGDERNGAWTAQDVLLYEWTTPANGHKEVFFRNTLSYAAEYIAPVLHEVQSLQARRQQQAVNGGGGLYSMLQWVMGMLWVAARLVSRIPPVLYSVAHMDTYFLLLDDRYGREMGAEKAADGKGGEDDEWDGPSQTSRRVTYALFAVFNTVGKLAGWRVWRDEYTPERLRAVAERTMG